MSDKMLSALNKQIQEEFFSANTYLAMASWCEKEGLNNCADFMFEHFEEEKLHMLKFVRFINEMGGHAIVPSLEQPQKEFDSVQSLFKIAFDHEKHITSCISKLVKLANEEDNFQAVSFLQWFVEEQMEEEVIFQNILDKIRLIGDSPSSLYFIEMEIEKINMSAHGEEGE
jgi:ferritin